MTVLGVMTNSPLVRAMDAGVGMTAISGGGGDEGAGGGDAHAPMTITHAHSSPRRPVLIRCCMRGSVLAGRTVRRADCFRTSGGLLPYVGRTVSVRRADCSISPPQRSFP